MAVESIDNAHIIQFSDRVHIVAQQIKARLRPHVEMRPMKGETLAYDGLGSLEASQILGRNQPVQFADIAYLRRRISRQRFALTLPIDEADVRSMLTSPQSYYAEACVRAMERVFDRVVVAALFATVYTGESFATAVTATADGVETVNATAGLTYQSILQLNQNFIDNEVGNDMPENIVVGLAGDEYKSLMQEVELINDLYSRQHAIDKGRLVELVGTKIVQFGGAVPQPILAVSAASVRSCFGMSSRGICVGMSKEIGVKVEPRPDLVETTQVQVVFDFGAVRTEGVLVQQINTTAVVI
ncbi:MAG: hypothetical protein KGJ13_02410 [Patescibacteria group bacterium]|nr:hypothetical protein [Patescibacteria group bacterium]